MPEAIDLLLKIDDQQMQTNVAHFRDGDWISNSKTNLLHGARYATLFNAEFNKPGNYSSILKRCTHFQEVFGHFKCRVNSARLMKIELGDNILIPPAREKGVDKIIIPIQADPKANFYVNSNLVNMQPGEVWFVDIDLPQKIENNGNSSWVHLELECVPNEWLLDQIKIAVDTVRMIDFLHEIEIKTSCEKIDGDTFLPGLKIYEGGLIIDKRKLKYPGDILHEAGHIAVVPKDRRDKLNGDVSESTDQFQGEEMAANLWSFAALTKLGIPVEKVFHKNAYKATGEWFIQNYNDKNYIGLPLLEWKGMAAGEVKAEKLGVEPFPSMIKWLQ